MPRSIWFLFVLGSTGCPDVEDTALGSHSDDSGLDTAGDTDDSGDPGSESEAAPNVFSTPDVDAMEGKLWSYPALARDANGDALTWAVTGPTGMVVNEWGLVTWTPPIDAIGPHDVTLTATDPSGEQGSQTFSVQVSEGDQPPRIVSEPELIATAGSAWTYAARVEDPDDNVHSWTLDTETGASVSSDGTVTWSVAAGAKGNRAMALTVTDPTGRSDTQEYSVGVPVPGDNQRPRITFSGGLGSATVTDNLDIRASVSDQALAGFDIDLCFEDGTCESLGRGLSPVEAESVATLDPHIYANGNYTVQVTARDASGNTQTSRQDITIDGEKWGALKLAFQDLTVRTRGGHWTLTRQYDGFELIPGSLGYGWSYSIDGESTEASGTVSVDKPMSSGWTVTYISFPPAYEITANRLHPVEFTLSDGRYYAFDVTLEHEPGISSIHRGRPSVSEITRTGSSLKLLNGSRREYSTTSYDLWLWLNSDGTAEVYTDSSFSTLWEPAFYEISTDLGETLTFRVSDGSLVDGTISSSGGPTTGPILDLDAGEVRIDDQPVIALETGSDGLITAAVDLLTDARVTYRRDAAGDLVEVTAADGTLEEFSYAEAHRLLDVQVDGNEPEMWWYDDQRRLIRYQGPAGQLLQHTYDDDANTVTSQDAAGNAIVTTHDDWGNAVSVLDPLGNETRMSYVSGSSRISSKTNPLGETTSYTYDADGNRTGTTNAMGETARFTWKNGAPTAYTDATGRAFTEVVDSDGNVTGYRLPDGTVAQRFTTTSDTITTTDALGRVSTTFDRYGRATQIDDNGQVTTTSFDDDAHTMTVTDPSGAVLTAELGVEDRFLSLEDEDGGRFDYTYDAWGLESVTAPDGSLHEWTRDAAGRVTEMTIDGEVQFSNTYDALGRLASVWKPGGATSYTYDDAGNLVGAVTPEGSVETTRDAAGRITDVTSDSGFSKHYEYDAAGRITAYVNASGDREDRGYDAAGRLTELADAEGRITDLRYDANGRIQRIAYPGGPSASFTWVPTADVGGGASPEMASFTGVDGVRFDYEYARRGEIDRVTDPLGNTTRFDAADGGESLTVEDAAGRTWRFDYGIDGDSVTWPSGASHQWTYGSDGLLERWDRPDDSSVTYSYGDQSVSMSLPSGDVLTIETDNTSASIIERGGSAGTYSRWLDADGRDRYATTEDGASVTLDWADDDLLEAVEAVLPDGSTYLTRYTWDADGLLESITDPDGDTTRFSWDGSTRLTQIDRPNSTRTVYAYGALDQPETVSHYASGSLVKRTTYTYDDLGLLAQEASDGLRNEYDYDDLGRLSSIATYDGSDLLEEREMSWDSVGNLESVWSSEQGTTTYSYDDDDVLLSIEGEDDTVTFSYSDRGARTERADDDGTTTYLYDDLDRLTSVILPDGSEVEYAYDVTGRLLSRTDEDGEVRCLPLAHPLTGHWDCAARYRTDGSSAEGLVHGPRGPLSFHGDTDTMYAFADRFGSIGLLADASASIVAETAFDAWGRATGDVSSHGWLGERQDPATGLVYLRARWYDPETGRFLTPDRFGAESKDPRTMHRYLYAQGDPLNKLDPTGEFTISGMLSGLSINSMMRRINTGAQMCAKSAVTSKLRQAVGQFAMLLAKDAVDEFIDAIQARALQVVGGSAVGMTEAAFDSVVGDYLCSKSKSGKGSPDVEFQVKLKYEGGYCGLRNERSSSSGCDRSTVDAVGSNHGIDLVFAQDVAIELKWNKLSGQRTWKQLKHYCRFAAWSSHVMTYGFYEFPTLTQLAKARDLCWNCWKPKYIKRCQKRNRPTAGSLFVAFAAKTKKGSNYPKERYYIPSAKLPCSF